RQGPGIDDSVEDRVLATILGIDGAEGLPSLPTAREVARVCDVARSTVDAALERARERWHKSHDINQMRDDIGIMLENAGGVMTAVELADAMLAARGSAEIEPA